VMVFADRKEKFSPLVTIHEDLKTHGVSILAVCKEKAHSLQNYAKRQKLPFVMGADWTGEVSALYGHYDPERQMISPGFVLADRDGIVRMALQGQNLPPEQIAALVRYAVAGL
jgi:peroxiredoxin